MTVSVSSALLATANAAAASAPDGSKNAAFCGALSTGIGSGYKLVARRDGVIVLSMTMSGSLASSSYGLSIPDDYATLTVLTAADIDTGSWTLRIEKASDAAVYLHGTLGTAGTDFTLSADLDPAVGIVLYRLFLRSPSIDTTSSTVPVGVGGSWTLTFEDHFNGGSLDSSKWSVPIWYGDLAGGSAGPNVANADGTVNYDVNAGGNSCLLAGVLAVRALQRERIEPGATRDRHSRIVLRRLRLYEQRAARMGGFVAAPDDLGADVPQRRGQ